MEMTPGLVLTLALAGGALAGWVLARLSRPGLAWALVGLIMAVALFMVIRAQGQQGVEGMQALAIALYLLAPAALGVGLGVILETLRRRRALPGKVAQGDTGPRD